MGMELLFFSRSPSLRTGIVSSAFEGSGAYFIRGDLPAFNITGNLFIIEAKSYYSHIFQSVISEATSQFYGWNLTRRRWWWRSGFDSSCFISSSVTVCTVTFLGLWLLQEMIDNERLAAISILNRKDVFI